MTFSATGSWVMCWCCCFRWFYQFYCTIYWY